MSIKSSIKRAIYHSGYYSLLHRFGVGGGPRLLILMYHDLVSEKVRNESWFDSYKLSESEFRAHIEEVQRLFRVMTVEDAVAEIKGEGQLREPTVAITFDDAYSTFYDVAYPILRELGASATVYVPTDWVSGSLRPWWLVLEQMCKELHRREMPVAKFLEVAAMKELAQRLPRPARNEWNKFKEQFESVLRGMPESEIDRHLTEIGNEVGIESDRLEFETTPMSWDQIAELAAAGIRFGAHTESHRDIRHLSDQEVREEFARSKEIVEKRSSLPVTGFAFPYGMDEDCYARLNALLEECGFSYACTARHGVNASSRNPYMLRRTTLPHTTSRALLYRQLVLDYRQQPST